jgi:predicted dehydrogenase
MLSRRIVLTGLLCLSSLPAAAQDRYKIAVIGLVHSHVWGHLQTMLKGEQVELAGIAEKNPELVAEAKKRGAANVKFYDDYKQMLDETKPAFVWAFVENNRHLEIVQAAAARKIHVIFEKPLASTYKEALAIQQLAGKSGIKVMCNYQMAWWPANYSAFEQVKSGALGQVWRLRGIVGHGGPGANGAANKYFFEWLTDPVKNGAGAMMDFECYNALWSLWYLGTPQTVFAQTNQLRPETFPKVEDTSVMVLHYKNGVGLFEGSWDLPRSFQELEVFGLKGSVSLTRDKVEMRLGKDTKAIESAPLPKEKSEPIAYMVHCIKNNLPVEGLTALPINVGVVEIVEAAKQSVKTGRAVALPLK